MNEIIIIINLKFEDNYPEYSESIYNKLAEIVEIVGQKGRLQEEL